MTKGGINFAYHPSSVKLQQQEWSEDGRRPSFFQTLTEVYTPVGSRLNQGAQRHRRVLADPTFPSAARCHESLQHAQRLVIKENLTLKVNWKEKYCPPTLLKDDCAAFIHNPANGALSLKYRDVKKRWGNTDLCQGQQLICKSTADSEATLLYSYLMYMNV